MPVVAQTYGATAHLSPLLHKTRRLGLSDPDVLLRLAVKRGCAHYAPPDYDPHRITDPGTDRLSNAELAIALISGAQEYDPQRMRCAAQLLSGPDLEPAVVVRLAVMERCGPLLRYIAEQAVRWDAERGAFWQEVAARLPVGRPIPAGILPHPSRFMLQSGYARRGRAPRPVWLRPRPV